MSSGWSTEAARRTKFLYQPSSSSSTFSSSSSLSFASWASSITTAATTTTTTRVPTYCRLSYQSGLLIVESCSPPAPTPEIYVEGHDDDDDDDDDDEFDTKVLETLDPADILGCDLELQFKTGQSMNWELTRRREKGKRARQAQDKEVELPTVTNVEKDNDNIQVPATATETPKAEEEEADALRHDTVSASSSSSSLGNVFTSMELDSLLQCNAGMAGGGKRSSFRNHAAAFVNIYFYPRQGKFQRRVAHSFRCPVAAPCCEDLARVGALVRSIRAVSQLRVQSPPPRLLILLNPQSGTGQSWARWKDTVRPMLEQAGVTPVQVVATTDAHFATQRMLEEDIASLDGIVALGGDGLLYQVVQGLQARPDADQVRAKLSLGLIPTGTNNGMAKSLAHAAQEAHGIVEATFMIGKSSLTRVDLARYQVASSSVKEYWGFLTFAYGLIADIDMESEVLRCLGSLRSDLFAVWKILWLPTYRVRFSYLPVLSEEEKMPSLDQPVPQHWITWEDDIVVFWPSQVSHASHDILQSPMSRLNDGVFHVLIVRRCWRYQLLRMFWHVGTGHHIHDPTCEVYRCAAWRLEPLNKDDHDKKKKKSYNVVDGEMVEDGVIQAQVVPSTTLQMFGRTEEPEASL